MAGAAGGARWRGSRCGRARRRNEHAYRGVGPKGYRRSDPRLHEQVCERLLLDPYLDASGIVVTVAKGKVALSGTVPTERMKSAALAAASRVAAGGVDCQVRVTAVAGAGPSRIPAARAASTSARPRGRAKPGRAKPARVTKPGGGR